MHTSTVVADCFSHGSHTAFHQHTWQLRKLLADVPQGPSIMQQEEIYHGTLVDNYKIRIEVFYLRCTKVKLF